MALTNTILAGDIGGTKTLLGLFTCNNHRPEPLVVKRYSTKDYDDANKILRDFIYNHAHGTNINAATLGVAGPVRNASCDLTNIPWKIDSTTISDVLNIDLPNVRLINDVEAMAYAIPVLDPAEITTLQEGDADPQGNTVLIAPGTGLGASVLIKLNNRFVSF